ncbi:ATG C terminal-containing protein [Venustampulla echinocandica]|uniref:Autophagy-related protein 2 n=1 Tax=Venustampulla echinocandica TaxID=2656787 RepID=A0A370TUN5_9HELO|nr:ATG C terminal-containing protein [Venustampulla echinocandica]RDL39188.1 ATG C terminal-containing protein [Venustampulla echinocandica]
MPKRLLQYALSRLEILETDGLDLENLDIAWGKNSTFEFRDVGLRLRKLENILQLPPSFELNKARVLLLRLTIPVDIYSSPIVVEVDGVEGQLRVKSKPENSTAPTSRTDHDRNRNGKSSHPAIFGAKSSSSRSRGGRGGSDFMEDDMDPAIPTAADLAESFLQTEPEKERAELEAAILSETEELGAASVLSDDGELPIGTGAPLSLPGFMTRFLQGIVDRLQVRIHGISVNLDIDIPVESSRATISNGTDPVTIQLRIDNVDIEGVTHDMDESSLVEDDSQKLKHKDGKRLVSLSKIRGALISEANLFSSLARSSALSSPSAAHSDMSERKSMPRFSSTRASGFRTADGTSSDHESIGSSRRSLPHSPSRSASGLRSLNASTVASDTGRFDDASEDGEASNLSGSLRDSLSEAGDSLFQNSAYLDELTESQFLDEEENRGGVSLPPSSFHDIQTSAGPSTPKASAHMVATPEGETQHVGTEYFDSNVVPGPETQSMLQSTILPMRPHSRFAADRVSRSQPLLSTGRGMASPIGMESPRKDVGIDFHDTDDIIDGSGDEEAVTPVAEDDLSKSQLFSHEDAESMYMSAISHTSSAGKVPGGWSNSSGDSDGPPTAPGSPVSPQLRNESRDNLEHALQHPATESPDSNIMQRSSASMSATMRGSTFSNSATFTHKRKNPSIPHVSSGVSERSATSSDYCSRLTKQILSLDRVDIYIPTGIPETDSEDVPSVPMKNPIDGQRDTSQSVSVNIPGSFSTHLPGKQNPTPPVPLRVKQPGPEPRAKPQPKDNAIEVVVGKLLTQFDISIGRLIFKIVRQLQETLNQDSTSPSHPETEPKEPSLNPNAVDFKLCAQKVSLIFLERLEGTHGSANAMVDTGHWVGPPDADILLRTAIDGLKVDSHTFQSASNTIVTVQKFSFGYAQENIVSFNAGLQMRASVRDLKTSDGIDLRVNLSKKDGISRCEVITLPMHISIDLQRLDESFSWFGGLSSVLNLGSSIASNATITATNSGKSKPHGVRFETPIKPDDKSQVAQNKADIRIGGFVLDLVGAECSIGVETSAIKVVHRDEGIGAFIQGIRLSGPRLRYSNDEPAIIADITSTRVEYLMTPKDVDLDRLLSLITPSKAQYDQDDDILLDTLLRQRKQGAVLRLTVEDFQVRMSRLDELSYLPDLGEEISRLSTVAKYLPDDDRPGLLSLIMIRKINAHVDVNNTLGSIQLSSHDIEVAHITLPYLVALSVGGVYAHRNGSEELIGVATDPELRELRARAPAIMARMIGDEMEPVVRIKLWNLRVEYRVPTLMTLLGFVDGATTQDMSAGLAESVATLTNFARTRASRGPQTSSASNPKNMALDVVMKDCILGLNPMGLPSKLLVVLTEGHLTAVLPKDEKTTASMELSKASLLIIDNVANVITGGLTGMSRRQSFDGGSSQVADLCMMGFVSISYISSAKAILVINVDNNGEQCIDVEFRDDLFVLETCADSTQTLIAALNALAPPSVPSKENKYRTKVIAVEDLLASLSGDAFGTAEGDYNFDDDFGIELPESGELESDELDFDSHFYQQGSEEQYGEAVVEDIGGLSSSARLSSRDTHDGVLLGSFVEPEAPLEGELEFHEDHFGTGSVLEGTAHRWNSVKNTYDRSNSCKIRKSPLKVCVRDMHIIWNLFDGYDWQNTRDTISKAVQDVESKAIEKRARNERRSTFDQDMDEEETVIGDFLFNSIYIGIPANRDPRELAAAINQELNDNVTETESLATTTFSSSPSRQGGARRPKAKQLRLNRSKHHKITFELKGVNVDLVTFPPGTGETQSSVDVRVHDFEIFDHIPSSTWRKFATYMQDAGERETGSSMIHMELLNVKPIPDLAAAEIVLKVTILPLRLHVDQDALDFITRFFEFKDDSAPVHSSPGDVPFIQRAEVNAVQVKLDFKPKRVDYAGLRSGHTTEFMNFLILDEADMVLRHTIIYGISGFDKLGKCLNDIWMPDVKRNQLPGILAGLAPVRSIVNVSGGIKHLVTVPVREYQKDGRIVRGISKGATAFAKTTGTELVKLGAKVAIGVQTVLQGAEGFLGPTIDTSQGAADDEDSEDTKHISLYANQPVGVLQGLRGGYTGLQRDLVMARDAIIAVPGEVMESGNAAGLLRAVRKHAPTVILRPAIGVAKAGGQILMGATNSLDPVNLQRADAKYKKH